MTPQEAQAVANLIVAVNLAQSRGAFNFADAAQVINAINLIGPRVDAILNPRTVEGAAAVQAKPAVLEEAAPLEAPAN